MAAPRIVQEHKSVSHSWRTQAHEGAVECVKVKVVEASGALEPLVRIYTGGRDSSIRIWSAKGKLIKELSGHTAAVTALQVSKDMVYSGAANGEIRVWQAEAGTSDAFSLHTQTVTALQVVNEGRFFSASMDGSILLWASDGNILRAFRKEPAAGVLAIQVTQASLLFAATEYGMLDIWDMSGTCLKTITTRSIENMPIRCLSVSSVGARTTVYCAVDSRLLVWTVLIDGENHIEVDRVVSYAKKSGMTRLGEPGNIHCFWPVFSEAYSSGQPVIYIGSSSGAIHLNLPTDRMVYTTMGDQARRYKDYTFRASSTSPVSCMAVANGRIYAGARDGQLFCWKEPLNMVKLRRKAVTQPPSRASSLAMSSSARPRSTTAAATSSSTSSLLSSSSPSASSLSGSRLARPTSTAATTRPPSKPEAPEIPTILRQAAPPKEQQNHRASYHPSSASSPLSASAPGAPPTASASSSLSSSTAAATATAMLLASPHSAGVPQTSQSSNQHAMPLYSSSGGLAARTQSGAMYPSLAYGNVEPYGSSAALLASPPPGGSPFAYAPSAPPAVYMVPSAPPLDQHLHTAYAATPAAAPSATQAFVPYTPPPSHSHYQATGGGGGGASGSALVDMQSTEMLLRQYQEQLARQTDMATTSSMYGTPQHSASGASAGSLYPSMIQQQQQQQQPQYYNTPPGAMVPPVQQPPQHQQPPDETEDDLCVICFDQPKAALLYPCGHMCACFDCGTRLAQMKKQNCPICREPIRDVVRVFK